MTTDNPDPAAPSPAAATEHRDALTGSPGSHPVGTGLGAAVAGAAGAVAGSVIPGIGTLIGGAVGAAVGAIAGGLAGKGVAEALSPTDEHAYWRDAYRQRDYYKAELSYDADYHPAYSTAIDVYNQDPARPFEQSQEVLAASWQARRGASRLDWDAAKRAMHDVYHRTRPADHPTGSSPADPPPHVPVLDRDATPTDKEAAAEQIDSM